MEGRLIVLVLAAGCGRLQFADEPLGDDVTHVPADAVPTADGVLVLAGGTIDTGALTIDGAAPVAGELLEVPQVGGGPSLALLLAEDITLTGTVTIVGGRPLVILARTIAVDGVLDASAHGSLAGPGARTVEGTGGHATHVINVCDAGGGGGGHAITGAPGGDPTSCGPDGIGAGGGGGGPVGDARLTLLVGGGPGGDAASGACGAPPGGGGGGALQLSATRRLVITSAGAVLAGGGGGPGGPDCGDGDAGAGGGGGAGGALYLEAPQLVIAGRVIAHGGGGGGGGNGSTGNGGVGPGGVGADGIDLAPAIGGVPPAPTSGIGGAGGTGSTAPVRGADADNNAGGGGGAAGIIAIRGSPTGAGVVSPTPTIIPRE